MRRDQRTEKDKALLRFYREYQKLTQAHKYSGTWVDVEPYQRGWTRSFVLREDAKNRTDAQELRRILDRINVTKYCKQYDFLQWNYKTKQMEPIPQHLHHLTPQEYNGLSQKQQSYFNKMQWIDWTYLYGSKRMHTVTGYVFHRDHYYVLEKSPNIISQHWVPDAELESRLGELERTMDVNNLWPKIYRAQGHSAGRGHNWDKDRYKNANGFEIDEDT